MHPSDRPTSETIRPATTIPTKIRAREQKATILCGGKNRRGTRRRLDGSAARLSGERSLNWHEVAQDVVSKGCAR